MPLCVRELKFSHKKHLAGCATEFLEYIPPPFTGRTVAFDVGWLVKR